jgi:hypothetical protein
MIKIINHKKLTGQLISILMDQTQMQVMEITLLLILEFNGLLEQLLVEKQEINNHLLLLLLTKKD